MKNSQKLGSKYGRLTVLDDWTAGGRRYVSARCECGRTTEVLAASLLSGKTKSCGRGACKTHHRVEVEPGYTPRPPRALTVEQVRKAWNRYHHPQASQRRTIAQLSVIHKVKDNTLMSIFRAVRRAGGINAYIKKVTQ
jgi:hypothetical protein